MHARALAAVGKQATLGKSVVKRHATSLPQIPGVIFANSEIPEDKLIGQVRRWAASSQALSQENAFDLLQVAENVAGSAAPRVVCGIWRTREIGTRAMDVEDGGCGCWERGSTREEWVYKGPGKGSYSRVGSLQLVGHGKGDFETLGWVLIDFGKFVTRFLGSFPVDLAGSMLIQSICCLILQVFISMSNTFAKKGVCSKRGKCVPTPNLQLLCHHYHFHLRKERYQVSTGTRCRCTCVALILAIVMVLAAMAWLELGGRGADPGAADPCDLEALSSEMQAQCCSEGHLRFCVQPAPVVPEQIIIHDKYFTHVKTVRVPRTVPVIEHKVYVHSSAFDCSGDVDWKQHWSPQHLRYCCYKRNIGCRTRLRIRPHYHTVTHVQQVTVPVPVPVPAPPARVVSRVVNVPIRDPPEIIKVPVRDAPHVVHKYIHQKQYVPVPEAPPKYHKVPVPPVKEPGVIKVPVPLPPKTVVKNKVIYRTRHVKVEHVYDCHAGFKNWKYGWSSAKQRWCCAHQDRGCPGTWKGHGLTKMVVTKVVEGVPVVVHGAIEGQTMAKFRLAEEEEPVPCMATLFYRTRDYLSAEFWEDQIRRICDIVAEEYLGAGPGVQLMVHHGAPWAMGLEVGEHRLLAEVEAFNFFGPQRASMLQGFEPSISHGVLGTHGTIPAAAMIELRPKPKSAPHTQPVSAMMRGYEPREEGRVHAEFSVVDLHYQLKELQDLVEHSFSEQASVLRRLEVGSKSSFSGARFSDGPVQVSFHEGDNDTRKTEKYQSPILASPREEPCQEPEVLAAPHAPLAHGPSFGDGDERVSAVSAPYRGSLSSTGSAMPERPEHHFADRTSKTSRNSAASSILGGAWGSLSSYIWEDSNKFKEKAKMQAVRLRASRGESLRGASKRVMPCMLWSSSVVSSPWFTNGIMLLILINVVLLGVEVDLAAGLGMQDVPGWLSVANAAFVAIFLLELILRYSAVGWSGFWCGEDSSWNIFDFIVIAVSVIDVCLDYLAVILSPSVNTGQLRLVRSIRLARALRGIRIVWLFEYVGALRTLALSIVSTSGSLFWTIVILVILVYSFGVVTTQLVIEHCRDLAVEALQDPNAIPECPESLSRYWASVGTSMLTLFASISGGLDWESAIQPLRMVSPMAVGLVPWAVLLYVTITVFAVLNVVIGVFCNTAIENAGADKELASIKQVYTKSNQVSTLKKIFYEIDSSGSDEVSIEDLEEAMRGGELKNFLESMGISTDDVWTGLGMFRLLNVLCQLRERWFLTIVLLLCFAELQLDVAKCSVLAARREDLGCRSCRRDRSGTIDLEEFVTGCMQLHGPAKSMQLAQMRFENRGSRRLLKQLQQDVHIMKSLMNANTATEHF
eukprot:s898_g15.t3